MLSYLLCSLVGIDRALYDEEGDRPWVPILFIKHAMSSKLIFEMPVSPTEVLRSSPLTPQVNSELHNFCRISYRDEPAKCREKNKAKKPA